MSKSGLADSPFFSTSKLSPVIENAPQAELQSEEKAEEKAVASHPNGKSSTTGQPRHRDTTVSRHHDAMTPRNHDTVVSSNHDTVVETIRKAVKEFGKEAATHRFTDTEKRAVLDIIYSYKALDIKTSENEVARIAINYILDDYKQNGQTSILDRVLKALNE